MRVSRSSVEQLGGLRRGLRPRVHNSRTRLSFSFIPSSPLSPSSPSSSPPHRRSLSSSRSLSPPRPRPRPRPRSSRPHLSSSPISKRNVNTVGFNWKNNGPRGDPFASLIAGHAQAPVGEGPRRKKKNPPPPPNRYRVALDALLAALRQEDTLKLYFCLLDLTRGASEDDELFRETVQTIPATTFSEVLRHFDPVNIANRVDSAPGINITYGSAVFTPLGELVNKWGVKVLYVQILHRLRLVQQARRKPQDPTTRPLLNDYALFLRFAGATSDTKTAKAVWWEMRADGYTDYDHTALYADFIKARYLTEAHYANNDLSRLRLRPLDLHRSTITLSPIVVTRLKRLQSNLADVAPHRFGQNVNEPYFAEPLTRLLRKRNPLQRIRLNAVARRMVPSNANLVCAILKANGRVGDMDDSIRLLQLCWNIQITRDAETGAIHIRGGADFPPGSSQAPTEALLDAVVHCFANVSEVDLATKLVDFISRRFAVPVPDSVWSDLLDFARIMQTKPAATEWEIVQFADKERIGTSTALEIWNLCTQEPHRFKPGMRDYYNLTKTIISSKKEMSASLEALRNIRPLYEEAVQEVQDAWLELILTTNQGLPNHAAYRRYRVAQSRKHYNWYCLHYATRQILSKVTPGRVDDNNAVRHIPDIVGEFGAFLPAKIKYLIATGVVELRSDTSRLHPLQFTQAVIEPRPLSERPRFVPSKINDMETDQILSEDGWPSQTDTTAVAEGREQEGSFPTVLEGQAAGEKIQEAQKSIEDKEDETVETTNMDRSGVDVFFSDASNKQSQDLEDEGTGTPVAEVAPQQPLPEHPSTGDDSFAEMFRSAFQEDINARSTSHPSEDWGDKAAPQQPVPEQPSTGDDSFAEMFRSAFQDSFNASSTSHLSEDWGDEEEPTVFTRKRDSRVDRLLERPAVMFRPPFSAPPDELSLSALRANNMEFTGFHDDPVKEPLAAHKVIRSMNRDMGVPVDLDTGRWDRKVLMKHVLRMKA